MRLNSTRILIMGTDPASVGILRRRLIHAGLAVLPPTNDARLLTVTDHLQPNLVVLQSPVLDCVGLDRCRRLRGRSSVPIVLMTDRKLAGDVEAALDAGADDCLNGAMPPRELITRIRTKLRRSRCWPEVEVSNIIRVGALRIDPGRHSVFVRDQEVPLRAKEFDLLALLAHSAGESVTYDEILRVVWGVANAESPELRKTVTVHIRWLRQKIEVDPDSARLIVTVRNVGYRLNG